MLAGGKSTGATLGSLALNLAASAATKGSQSGTFVTAGIHSESAGADGATSLVGTTGGSAATGDAFSVGGAGGTTGANPVENSSAFDSSESNASKPVVNADLRVERRPAIVQEAGVVPHELSPTDEVE